MKLKIYFIKNNIVLIYKHLCYNPNVYFILSQIMGGIALILIFISYFFNKKEIFLFVQIFANFFYALSFIFVNALVGGLNTLISIIRILILYFYIKKGKDPPIIFIPLFAIIYIIIGVIFIKDYYDIITIITPILFTIAMWMKNMQITRYYLIIPNLLLIIYSIINTAYTSAILSFVEILILVIAILKQKRISKKDINNII